MGGFLLGLPYTHSLGILSVSSRERGVLKGHGPPGCQRLGEVLDNRSHRSFFLLLFFVCGGCFCCFCGCFFVVFLFLFFFFFFPRELSLCVQAPFWKPSSVASVQVITIIFSLPEFLGLKLFGKTFVWPVRDANRLFRQWRLKGG